MPLIDELPKPRWVEEAKKKTVEKENLTCTEAAYLAGIIDGEGSLTIVAQKDARTKKYYFNPRIDIANTDTKLMNWLVNTLLVGSIYVQNRENEGHKTRYCYSIAKNGVAWLIPQIKPYIKIKFEQLLALERFIELRDTGKLTNELTCEIRAILRVFNGHFKESDPNLEVLL